MADLAVFTKEELCDAVEELDGISPPDLILPIMTRLLAEGVGKSIHICAIIKSRAAEVIMGGPRTIRSELGDLVRASTLEHAAATLTTRAQQIRECVRLGLPWTADPKRHAKRKAAGQ